jgi:hypothetical protein
MTDYSEKETYCSPLKRRDLRAIEFLKKTNCYTKSTMGTVHGKPSHNAWTIESLCICEPCPSPSLQKVKTNLRRQETNRKHHMSNSTNALHKTTSATRHDPESPSNSMAMSKEIAISEEEKINLNAAVHSVSKQMGRHLPRYNELNSLDDYHLLGDDAQDFWVRVSEQVPSSTGKECFLKYKHMHASDVARFMVKGHELQHRRSESDIETVTHTPLQSKPAVSYRRHSQAV